MTEQVQQLYPTPSRSLPLERLYLDSDLHWIDGADGPIVYANFVSSLDGRIAVPHRDTHQVPPAIGNRRDWRLYQELAGQADVLITSARYFRQFAAGTAQARLPVGEEPQYRDIHDWRAAHRLASQPDVAIVSASLDIPAKALTAYSDRRIHVLTGEMADARAIRHLEAAGCQIHFAGSGHTVDGRAAVGILTGLGYRRLYAIAGSSVFHTLLAGGVLDRLYLTLAHRLLGGEEFDTLTWGSLLAPPQNLQLRSLYHDPAAPAGAGQLLTCYDCLPREP